MADSLESVKDILGEKLNELSQKVSNKLNLNDNDVKENVDTSLQNLISSIDKFTIYFNDIVLEISEAENKNENVINSLKLYLDGLEEVIELLQNSVLDIKNNYNIK